MRASRSTIPATSGLIATASVNVPNDVPFIGGTKLGSMKPPFLYSASSNSGSIAAWTSVNCYFFTVTTGFEYSFSSGSSGVFSVIGFNAVGNIESQFNSITSSDTSTPPTYTYSYVVNVDASSGANGLSVQASWPANSGTQTLLVSGPNDNGNFYSLTSRTSPRPINS